MKPIQPYSTEAIEKLKQWITDMNAKGDAKYYEIFVDGMRVVQKTNDSNLFDDYENWADGNTQVIKVLIYNTLGSHRSKPFEFRTVNYPEEVNYKEISETLLKKNEELTKRVGDAESYIKKLELKLELQEQNPPGNDLQSFLNLVGPFLKKNPELLERFGLGDVLNADPPKHENESTEVTYSFKKKGSVSEQKDNPIANEKNVPTNSETKLGEDQLHKVQELTQFFNDNPAYITIVHDLVTQEKQKLAA